MGTAETDSTAKQNNIPPDPGRYEIRFRLTGFAVLSISLGLALIALSIVSHHQISARIFGILIGGLCAVPYLVLLVSRKTLFRADQAGITLGPELGRSGLSSTVFIPWMDIKNIALYQITRRSARTGPTGSYIKIVPRDVPRTAYATARRIDTLWQPWRLDNERLTAVVAAAAPRVHIVDAGFIDPWVDADMQRFLHLDSK
jgi:hypothetical protein